MNTPTQQPSPVAADAISEAESLMHDLDTCSPYNKERIDECIAKLRAALASRAPVQQPAAEPVAWCLKHKDGRLSYPSIRHEMAVVHQKFLAQDRVIQPTIFQMQMQEDPKPYQYVGQQTEIIPLYVSPPQPASAPTGEGE